MDIDQIKLLTDLMVANDLTEVVVRDGESRILIRRNVPGAPAAVAVHSILPASAAAVSHAVTVATPAAAAAGVEDGRAIIKSPMVGTFYATPDPESSPFVSVGSPVEPDTVVCIIEAMKVFNEIKSETSGTIEAVLVSSGQPVEYGQALFRVAPR